MTGTNSSNGRLVLRQNVEINSNEYFSVTYFFGNEIVDHVACKRHCAITKKNVFWVQSYFNDSLWFTERLSVEIFIYSSFVTIDDVIFQFLKKLSFITEALFLVRCAVVLA